MLEKFLMRRLGQVVSLSCVALLGACGDDPAQGPAVTHDDVATILGAGPAGGGTCSINTCHGDGAASGDLNLRLTTDLTELLVNKPACEAPSLMLVEPGAPERSWLYIKLTGETKEGSRDLAPDPSWGEPGQGCEDATGFGKKMPETGSPLSEEKVEQIRQWILDGAPGP